MKFIIEFDEDEEDERTPEEREAEIVAQLRRTFDGPWVSADSVDIYRIDDSGTVRFIPWKPT